MNVADVWQVLGGQLCCFCHGAIDAATVVSSASPYGMFDPRIYYYCCREHMDRHYAQLVRARRRAANRAPVYRGR